ncbi:unnamed protein product [Ixodes hexagonus]
MRTIVSWLSSRSDGKMMRAPKRSLTLRMLEPFLPMRKR